MPDVYDMRLTETEPAPRRKQMVMIQRDAMINGGFTFAGVLYQTRPDDRENIAGAAQLAALAIQAGAVAGDLKWANQDPTDPTGPDFTWIAADNSETPMDAPTMIAFGKAVARYKSALIFYAKALKEQIDAAADPETVDIYSGWPAASA